MIPYMVVDIAEIGHYLGRAWQDTPRSPVLPTPAARPAPRLAGCFFCGATFILHICKLSPILGL